MFEIDTLMVEQPKKHKIYSLILILILLITIIINTYTYDRYQVLSYNTKSQTLKIYVPESISINEATIIKYKDKNYNIEEVEYLSSQIENNVIYKELLLKTNINTKEEIITINILNNKQRIITKIINAVKEN